MNNEKKKFSLKFYLISYLCDSSPWLDQQTDLITMELLLNETIEYDLPYIIRQCVLHSPDLCLTIIFSLNPCNISHRFQKLKIYSIKRLIRLVFSDFLEKVARIRTPLDAKVLLLDRDSARILNSVCTISDLTASGIACTTLFKPNSNFWD
jgi:hypothetical protein